MIVRSFIKYLIIQVALNLLKFTQSFMGKKGVSFIITYRHLEYSTPMILDFEGRCWILLKPSGSYYLQVLVPYQCLFVITMFC